MRPSSSADPTSSSPAVAIREYGGLLRDRLRPVVVSRFGVDTRALAALRIALGALIAIDLALRARSLRAFYTDSGVFPRSALGDVYPTLSQLSLHALSGAYWWQLLLFLVAGGVAIALVLGYRTRLAAVVSLLLLVSLHVRNPVVLNAGDVVLRRLLFWGCFLPLGRRWSLDAHLRRTAGAGDSPGTESSGTLVASLASAALLLQVVTIYTVNALFKLRSDVWLSGRAVERALAMGKFSTPLADLLFEVPLVLELGNWVWLALLVSAPFLVLVTGRIRVLHVVLFAAVHLGMLATMALGIFPLVLLAGMLPFLPSGAWTRLESHLPIPDSSTETRASQSVADGGQADSTPLYRAAKQVVPVLVAGFVVIAATWNLAALGVVTLDTGGSTLGPDTQRWDMFAGPGTTDLQIEVVARTDDGATVDAMREARLGPSGLVESATGYPSARWRKYLVSMRYGDPPGLRDDLAATACRRLATDSSSQPRSVSITAVHTPTRVADSEVGTRYDLGTYECG